MIVTYSGYCTQLTTTGLDLTIVVGYDKHSWTAGWRHFMDGMTVFYNEWEDLQMESKSSFQGKSLLSSSELFNKPSYASNLEAVIYI